MSQAGKYTNGGGGSGGLQTLTGNNPVPVPGDINENINIIGEDGITVTGNALTNTLSISGAGLAPTIKFTKFTASGTFTKDPRSLYITLLIWNGGGGGGSGQYEIESISPVFGPNGGYGGSGGALMLSTFLADQFADNEPVIIGDGGIGGASQTVLGSNGLDGSQGGISYLGEIFPGDRSPAQGTGSVTSGVGNGGFGGGTVNRNTTPRVPSGFFVANHNYNYTNVTSAQLPNAYAGNAGGGGQQASGNTTNFAQYVNALSGDYQYVCSGGGGGGSSHSVFGPYIGGDSGAILAFGSQTSILAGGGPPLASPTVIVRNGALGGQPGGDLNGQDGQDLLPNGGGRVIGATGGGGASGEDILNNPGFVGNGGNAGIPSAGGGAGGASQTVPSGAGGNGSRGEIWIWETFGTLIT